MPIHSINYKSWCDGCPIRSEKEYQTALSKYKQIMKLKKELMDLTE